MNFIEEKILEKGNLNKLCFRFPPEPSGQKSISFDSNGKEVVKYNSGLHLGHAKSICLNFGLAKKYNAPCILRFDDTNPTTEEGEYVESMIDDIKWLGFVPSKITYTSDYFDFIYESAINLIKNGLAYVDDSTSEEIAKSKGTPTRKGKNSKFRSRSVEENLDLFERMNKGEFKEGEKILRAKIDMSSPNMILRDPVLYRIIDIPHFKTKNKYHIYPMYDFAHPLCDYVEKISDSLCTLEFEIHRPLYMWVLENCNLSLPYPEETEFARLNLDYSVMSKRKIKILLEEGLVDGWDDPRLPTISGLRRRGYTPESIINFCEKIGVTKKESSISLLLLEECLREDLNKRSIRMMGIMDPIKLTIENFSGTEWISLEKNPEDKLSGYRLSPLTKTLWIERSDFKKEANSKFHRLKLGGEVRLKGAYVIKATNVIEKDGEVIEVRCTYDPSTKSGMTIDRKIKGTIHWVSIDYGISRVVNNYEMLFNKINPDDDFLNDINDKSLVVNTKAVFEPYVDYCKSGYPVQMIRNGYYVLDSDGKSFNRTVSLKEGWVE